MLRWLDELSAAGIFTTDATLTVRTWNRWMERHTATPAGRAIGSPLLEMFPDLSARGILRYYESTLAGEVNVLSQSLHRFVFRMQTADRPEPMPQSVRIAPLMEEGDVIGTITVIEDVSERVLNEREMRRQIIAAETARATAENALRLKDEFLANLSHEIRTPLNAVIGWTRILLSRPCDAATLDRALRVIDRNAAAQAKLIEDMLDMARIVSGKLRLHVAPIDLSTVTRAAMDVILPAADAKGVKVHARLDGAPHAITADADRVQQIAWNLLSNAVKFTPPGGSIEVAVDETSEGVRLVVKDTGEGITADFLPYVFERFRQADASASRTEGGLGLGLALVHDLVHLHGGRIHVASAGKGAGATFTVIFPALEQEAASAGIRAQVDLSLLHNQRVLVVDDDADWRDLLSIALLHAGAQPLLAGSCQEGLDLLRSSGAPRVVVTDIAMPTENGYTFLEKIRAMPEPVRSVAVIAVTAYAGPGEEARAKAAGFDAFRAKPLPPDETIALIVEMLKARAGSRPIPSR
jgi:signal transduction histidine kinase/ActR/RegA family two-component response regulator